MKGRKPKPVQQQIIQGDPGRRGKHQLQRRLQAEAVAVRGLSCPKHLRGEAQRAWEFWRGELEAMQIDCRPDAMMLEGACRNYARAVEADLLVEREGAILDEAVYYRGKPVKDAMRKRKHPGIAISNAAWTLVKAFCSEFGLSPASRSRLVVESKDASAEANFHALLSGPKLTDEERRRILAGEDQHRKTQ